MSDYGDFCREQRNRKNEAKRKMVDCPWANYRHKTWPGETCMRCNEKVDSNGDKVYENEDFE